MNPNNRAQGTPIPHHPEFGNLSQPPPGQKRAVPAGAAVKDGTIVQRTMRGGKPYIRMRPM